MAKNTTTATTTKAAKGTKAVETNGKAKGIPDQVNKEIRWTPAKINLIKALKKIAATSSGAAKTVEQIAKASGGKLTVQQVEHQVTARFDLTAQGIIDSSVFQDERFKRYFLTAKGMKVNPTPFEAGAKTVAAK